MSGEGGEVHGGSKTELTRVSGILFIQQSRNYNSKPDYKWWGKKSKEIRNLTDNII